MPANWRDGFEYAYTRPDPEPEGPGLVWRETGANYWSGSSGSQPRGTVMPRGSDATGRFYAQGQGHNGRFGVYFAPWVVSDGTSQWLDGFDTVEEAMAAADRYVAGYLDAAGE